MKNTIKFRFAGIGIMLVTYAVFGAAVMLLWNALLPGIFGFSRLSYLHALGLLLLTRILFSSLGNGGWGHGKSRRHAHDGNGLRFKWITMSDDERKEFIQKEKEVTQQHGFPCNEEDRKMDGNGE